MREVLEPVGRLGRRLRDAAPRLAGADGPAVALARWAFRIAALVIGGIVVYRTRNYMNPDGVSYIDVGDALARGDLTSFVNRYWSPLYPLVLLVARALTGFSARYEFPAVHAAIFAQYALCLVAVEHLVAQLLRPPEDGRDAPARDGQAVAPAPMLSLLVYPFFFWFTVRVVNVYYVTPDLLAAALCMFAAGLVARLRAGRRGVRAGVALGVVLGLAFLTKTAMLFVGAGFLAAAWLAGGLRRGFWTVVVAGGTYALVAGIWIALLSAGAGRLTYGDSGRLNYAWVVNGVHAFAHAGEDQGRNGQLVHTPRVLGQAPRVYEFAEPVHGTYPLWTDPAYWYEGLRPPYVPELQRRALARTWRIYKDIAREQGLPIRMFFVALLTLLVVAGRRFHRTAWGMVRRWELLIPAVLPLVMYALVNVHARYVGAFAFLLGLALLQSVRVPRERLPWLLAPALAVSVVLGWTLVSDALDDQDGRWDDTQYRIAEAMAERGLEPGTPVGHVGRTFDAYWARLGRYRIVAEVPRGEDRQFYRTTGARRARVLDDFRSAGAQAVVVSGRDSPGQGWERLAGADAWLLVLDD